MDDSVQVHVSLPSRSLSQAYVHDEAQERAGKPSYTRVIQVSLCVTLANILLAKGGHTAEHRAKGTGTLLYPK